MTEFKLDHLSYSTVNQLLQCPYSVKLRKIDGEDTVSSTALDVGSAVHAAIAEYWQTRSVDKVIAFLAENHLHVFDEAMAMTRAYLERFGHLRPSLWEQRLEVEIGGVKVVGVIDMVLTDGTIVEIKTTRDASAWASAKDYDWQPALYAILLGADEIRAQYHVITRPPNLRVLKYDVARSVIDIENARRLIETAAAIVRTDKWPAKPGRYCRYCGVRHSCTFYMGGAT